MFPDALTLRLKSTPVRWPVTLTLCLGTILLAGSLPAFGQDALKITTEPPVVWVRAGDVAVLQYQYVERPMKPYAKQLFSPRGVNVLRDAPADHLHHHALMFAVAVDGVSFWSEGDGCGCEKHRSLTDVKTFTRDGLPWAGFTQQIDWTDPGSGNVLLEEQRTIEVCRDPDAEATMLAWRTRLEAPADKGSVTLAGSHYYGLGIRFVQSMDKVGRFFSADGREGEVVRGDNRLVRSRWCAYTAPVDGKPVTVAVFDHPDNPRHPARMFTMTRSFAFLGATLNLWKEPLTLKTGQPLLLRYGVAVWDGQIDPARIDRLYQRWASQSVETGGS